MPFLQRCQFFKNIIPLDAHVIRTLSLYTSVDAVAVVVELGQNVIKWNRLRKCFRIISFLIIFELGCLLGTKMAILDIFRPFRRGRVKIEQNVIKQIGLGIFFRIFSFLHIFIPE
jgi:hypothetical protein